jgi:hypothetical protein
MNPLDAASMADTPVSIPSEFGSADRNHAETILHGFANRRRLSSP